LIQTPIRKIFIGVVGLGAFLALWAFVFEPSRLVTRQQTLQIPSLPTGLRVAVWSDLHAGSPFIGIHKVRRVINETNALQPDLILLLGDYVIQGVIGGSFIEPSVIANELKALRAPLGVCAVLGNHDHWDDAHKIEKVLSDAGIRVLENKAVQLQFNLAPFWVLGLIDEWHNKNGPSASDLIAQQINNDAPIIAITHNPDTFLKIPARVSLTLAGHTHGGQCAFPLLGRPIVPSEFGERFVTGHVIEEGRHLFVTNGIGTSILPVRFRVPPEIVLLTLSR
jgi:hypothetical protein